MLYRSSLRCGANPTIHFGVYAQSFRTLSIISPDIWTGYPYIDANAAATELEGLAEVALLADKWAAFKFTEQIGRPLSCFNGAVRIYWPMMNAKDDPLFHRLYLPNIIRYHEARGHPFSKYVFRTMATISSVRLADFSIARSVQQRFREDENSKLAEIRSQVVQGQLEKGELEKQLLESWSNNDKLVDENTRLKDELETQRTNWECYKDFVQEDPAATQAESVMELEQPVSVSDAVRIATTKYTATLQFLDSATASAEESPYKNPELVVALFEAINEIVMRWRAEGKLGTTWKDALAQKGFDYKPDISATATQKKMVGDYTFLYQGKRLVFGEHVTLGIGQDPQECLSVHWHRDEERKLVVVGSCGKHGKNTKS